MPPASHSCAGRTLLERLWEELDAITDRLMADGEPELSGNVSRVAEDFLEYGEERGRAQGVAYAIAIITNPYKVDVPRIKRRAMKRWERRNR